MEDVAVVYLHGFFGDKWDYAFYDKYLRARGVRRSYGFTYSKKESFSGVKALSKKFYEFTKNIPEKRLIFVGTSLGGITAAYTIENTDLKKRALCCISICSPFAGTLIAHVSLGQTSKDLQPGSNLLKALNRKIEASKAHYYTFWNPLDTFILPGSSGRLKTAVANHSHIHPFHITTARWTVRKELYDIVRKESKRKISRKS